MGGAVEAFGRYNMQINNASVVLVMKYKPLYGICTAQNKRNPTGKKYDRIEIVKHTFQPETITYET